MSVSAENIVPLVKKIVSELPSERGSLVPVLQRIQRELGYLPLEAVEALAQRLMISANEIYGVASFYSQFRFRKPGEHKITLCQGTACHVRGSQRLLGEFESRLGLDTGQTTTADGKFDLERVACIGCCALAPVVMVDDQVHGRLSIQGVDSIICAHERGTDEPTPT
jgi:NADH-quinone oxidoreductase subunit E